MPEFRPFTATAVFPYSLLIPSAALCMLVLVGFRLQGAGWTARGGMALAGLLTWTLVEYGLHRFILHGLEPFRRWHREHHREPDEPMRTPWLFSLAFVLTLLVAPFLLWADTGSALAFSVGLLLGHLAQESVHHKMHQPGCPGRGWLARRQRLHAFHHHDNEAMAFGTLTAFWDRWLGTAPGARPAR